MYEVDKIEVGTRVLAPRHGKKRGQDRIYDAGVVTELDGSIATIRLDEAASSPLAGRIVFCPAVLLELPSPVRAAEGGRQV